MVLLCYGNTFKLFWRNIKKGEKDLSFKIYIYKLTTTCPNWLAPVKASVHMIRFFCLSNSKGMGLGGFTQASGLLSWQLQLTSSWAQVKTLKYCTVKWRMGFASTWGASRAGTSTWKIISRAWILQFDKQNKKFLSQ